MKAAVLEEFGTMPSVREWPDPVLGTGEVLVDVVAAPVLPYAGEVFRGERNYLLTLPVVPGSRRGRAGARDRPGRDPAQARRLGVVRPDHPLP